MKPCYFVRLYRLGARAIVHLPRHAFKDFKEEQAVSELLDDCGPDHIWSQSLDAFREKAEAWIRSEGAGDVRASEPDIIPLPQDKGLFSSSPPNLAFVWPERSGGDKVLIVPLRLSRELAEIENRERRQRLPGGSLFGGRPTV